MCALHFAYPPSAASPERASRGTRRRGLTRRSEPADGGGAFGMLGPRPQPSPPAVGAGPRPQPWFSVFVLNPRPQSSSGTRTGVSTFRTSPRKKRGLRRAVISMKTAPSSSTPTPMTNTLPMPNTELPLP